MDLILLGSSAVAVAATLLVVVGVIIQRFSHQARKRRLQAGIEVLQPSYIAFLLGELDIQELLGVLKHHPRAADYLPVSYTHLTLPTILRV